MMGDEPIQGPSKKSDQSTSHTNLSVSSSFTDNGSSPKKLKVSSATREGIPSGSREPGFCCSGPNCSSCSSTTWRQGSITTAELRKLVKDLKSDTQKSGVLLVDCRTESAIQKERIGVFPWVNVPPFKDMSTHPPNPIRMTTKVVVVNFLNDQCKAVLNVLNAPGKYTHIIVYDDHSTAANCSSTIVTLLAALSKWNEKTRTATLLLEGGFSKTEQLLYTMFDINYMAGLDIFHTNLWKNYKTPAKLPDLLLRPAEHRANNHREEKQLPTLLPLPKPNPVIDKAQEQVETTFQVLVDKLKAIIETTTSLLDHRKKKYSLNAVRVTLQKEPDMSMALTDNIPVPDEMQCPVCLDMLTTEIFQCSNGHCVCSSCYKGLTACSVCRVRYLKGGIRNRSLEQIMSTMEIVDCPLSTQGCTNKLTYHQIAVHLKTCKYGAFSAVVKLEQDLKTVKTVINFINQQLAVKSRDLITAEEKWKCAMHQWNPPLNKNSKQWYVEHISFRKLFLVKLDMEVMLYPDLEFMKTQFSNEVTLFNARMTNKSSFRYNFDELELE